MELEWKLEISSPSIREFFRWVVNADTTSPQQVAVVLRKRTKSQKTERSVSISAVTDSLLLLEAPTEQVRQAMRALTAVQAYASSDERVGE